MAVQPILASTFWASTSDAAEEGRPAKRRRLATTCTTLDHALDGGFDYATINCISSEADSSHKALSISVLAAHLLKSGSHQATVVDTTNSFDVRKLHARLVGLLDAEPVADGMQERALGVLNRVRIMKAFDFVGLTECLSELRGDLEQQPSHAPTPRATVGDGEDEEEMLDRPVEVTKLNSPKPPPATNEDLSTDTQLLIIDNMTQVATPLLKNSHVQGQSLLASFMGSLGHLTCTYNICTILLNAAVAYKNSFERETPSIFSSCALQPALGKSFSNFVDVHLLLHNVPLTAEDAQVVYGTQASTSKSRRIQADVLEVLQDRYSNRIGRWAAFRAESEGRLKSIS